MSSDIGGSQAGWRRHSKLIIVGSLVALIVAGSGLYYLVSSFGGSESTPKCILVPSSDGNHSYTLSNVTHESSWSQVEIRLVNVTNTGMHRIWYPQYESLHSSTGEAAAETYLGVGSWGEVCLSPACTITDIEGDGRIGSGDFFTLNLTECALGVAYQYELVLLYPDTGIPIATYQF
jgi:hypothetical protein